MPWVFAGFAAIGFSVGATTAVGAVVAGIAVSAAVGAAVGGLVAAVTGGDILKGMLFGAVGGLVVGGVFGVGIGGAISGVTGQGAAATSQLAMGATASEAAVVGAGGITSETLTGAALTGGAGAAGGAGAGGMSQMTQMAMWSGATEAFKAAMSPDPGAVTDKDKFIAEQNAAALDKKIQAELEAAAAASDFHLLEKMKLQDQAGELRQDEIRLAEQVRQDPHRKAGGVRRAAGGYVSQQGVSGEAQEVAAAPLKAPTKTNTPQVDRPYTRDTALRGMA